jgi:hypothetical protein
MKLNEWLLGLIFVFGLILFLEVASLKTEVQELIQQNKEQLENR